jgi:hypothetical protein
MKRKDKLGDMWQSKLKLYDNKKNERRAKSKKNDNVLQMKK